MVSRRLLRNLLNHRYLAAAWAGIDAGEWHDARSLLHPYLRFQDGAVALRGRNAVLEHLRSHPTPKPPAAVEVRDGQLYRWIR